MDFTSDNAVGASPAILQAIVEANSGAAAAYGADRWSVEAAAALDRLFERQTASFLVATGTAANALALALCTPPWGAILCHAGAHIHNDECGAPEFFSGAKLIPIDGAAGKITPGALEDALAALPKAVKQVQPAALSLSQATECGTLYSCAEIAALADIAHREGLAVHMDGARFSNALAELDCSAPDMSWRAGVDILSFGATKNGALACEAVILFDGARMDEAEEFAFRRKRAGHTLSKGRFLGAQMAAFLKDDHWLHLARRANAAARRLETGLRALPGARLPWPRQANEIFAILPARVDVALRAAGARYHPWTARSLAPAERPGPHEAFVRLIASFATTESEIDRLLAIAQAAAS